MSHDAPPDDTVTLALAGDVMLGRGIDQVLSHSVSPELHEPYVRDARDYVRLAEHTNGPIPRPVDPAYPWGEALAELREATRRLINLETAVTTSPAPWPDKGINYRMHPANIGCLAAAGIDACSLANNHVLDWERPGLTETLATLDAAGVARAGAGADAAEAARPAVVPLPGGGRLLVWGLGLADSGIPEAWRAGTGRSGVNLVEADDDGVAGAIAAEKRPGDLVVASVHWGGNWGYAVPDAHRRLAHRLIDAGADLIHGHSSHHPRGLERYRGRPILYGCGDLINDYEGIHGHEGYFPDLAMLVGCRWTADRDTPQALWLTPLRRRRFTLERAAPEEADWLAETLNRHGQGACPPLERREDNRLWWTLD
ncbi:CapA family protein [Halomonas ramblicola]|uniref:CapA family protein n=1 Tax=Halomonas ramblicola TaxID=747349 RepID=UPI0025B5F3A4|nr:CapA family protein [Halomonas ramblicola]MDN3520156.1 CapA family protein [Halomonas ramblicola]